MCWALRATVVCSNWTTAVLECVCRVNLSLSLSLFDLRSFISVSSLSAVYLLMENQTVGFYFLTNEAETRQFRQMFPPKLKCLSCNSPRWQIRGQTVCVFKEERHITYLTVVCLVLILNQSVLKRAEGLLINFNTNVYLCKIYLPSVCMHSFIDCWALVHVSAVSETFLWFNKNKSDQYCRPQQSFFHSVSRRFVFSRFGCFVGSSTFMLDKSVALYLCRKYCAFCVAVQNVTVWWWISE